MHDPLIVVLLALTIVIGVGVLVLIGVLVTLAVVALKTRKRVLALIDRVESAVAPHIGPIATQVHSVVDDLTPKVKHIATNVSAISDTLRSEAQHISVSVGDMVERTHQQAARVDGMVSSTLSGIGHASHAVEEAISVPIRHISGVIDGMRVGISSLLRREHRSNGRYTGPTVVRKVDADPL